MIHYDLVCEADHAFDGWFRSSADFDAQSVRGLVTCPRCGSPKVTRALMAPNVQMSRRKARTIEHQSVEHQTIEHEAPTAALAPTAPPATVNPVVTPDPRMVAALEALREIRAKVTAEADYVGPRFAEEARRIHYGETEKRGIWGEANGEEIRKLVDEGIECHPLPVLPDDFN
jgi:hypothetical protein